MKIFVDVDTQCDFMNENGALYVPNAEKIKPILWKLTKLAKESQIQILKTMDTHDGTEPEMNVNGGPFPFHCMKETVGQASIRETSSNNAITFSKQCYDVFDYKYGNKSITSWLKDNNVTEAWVYGVCTEYCVLAVVLGLRKLGITTYVFENAIQHLNEEDGKKAKQQMRDVGALFAVAKI